MNYLMGKIEQSVRERGGYPTRGGVAKKTKMQERAEARMAEADAALTLTGRECLPLV